MKLRTLLAACTLGAAAMAQMSIAAGPAAEAQAPAQSAGEYASDALVTGKVKAAFVAEKNLSALDIAVQTRDGVVHLGGEVDEAAQREAAERVARGIDGVKGVENEIKVKGN